MAKKILGLVGRFDNNMIREVTRLLPNQFELELISPEDDHSKLRNIHYMITRQMLIDREVISAAPKLEVIQRWGSGYDKVDVAWATERGIPVLIAAGVNAVSVSEHAVLLMLAVLRRITLADRSVHRGTWLIPDILEQARTLSGKTVGLVGFGNIARLVAEKVNVFGAKVQYYDLVRGTARQEQDLRASYVSLDTLMRTSDIVSIHVPLTAQTDGLIGEEEIGRMKPEAVLINTARGKIVVEQALADALEENRLSGAGIDTFENEPVKSGNRLLTFENVICTPHIGGSTLDNHAFCARHCMNNLMDALEGREFSKRDLVNPEYKVCSL